MIEASLGCVRRASKIMLGAKGPSFMVTLSVTAALLVVGLYAMIWLNSTRLLGLWQGDGVVACSLNEGLPSDVWEAVRQRLAALPGVRSAVLFTPQQALDAFAARGVEQAQLVAGIEPERLPATVELTLLPQGEGDTALGALGAAVRALPEVSQVDVEAVTHDKARATLRLVRLGGLALGLALVAAAALMAANLIGLVIHTQREEIAILLLVGGTPNFIRAPYLLQGATWGLWAAAFASGALYLLDRHCRPMLRDALAAIGGPIDVPLFEPRLAMALLLAGLSLGVVATFVALQRFLRGGGAAAEEAF